MQILNRMDRNFIFVYMGLILVLGVVFWLGSGRVAVWWGVCVLEVVYGYFALRRSWRRYRALLQPFPEEWRFEVARHSMIYAHLKGEERLRFERDIQIFLKDFSITGIRGQAVDIAIKLPIATAFATLLWGHPEWEPPIRDGVVVYPGRNFDRNFKPGRGSFEGIATVNSPLIVTEESLKQSFANPGDGDNVVFHELAHYFDFEDGVADGIPMARMLPGEERLARWQQTVRAEWERVNRGESYLRSYAGTNEAELFAVAVEVFFENPQLMLANSPEFYGLLKEFFNIDPVEITLSPIFPKERTIAR